MRNLYSSIAASMIFVVSTSPAKADYDAFGIQSSGNNTNYIYGIDSTNGTRTLLSEKAFSGNSYNAGNSFISSNTGEIFVFTGNHQYHVYNWSTNTWRDTTITASGVGEMTIFQRPSIGGGPSDGSIVLTNDGDSELLRIKTSEITSGGSNGETMIKQNNDGTIQLGADGDDIDVVADGLNIDGAAVITKNADGTIQIGTDENDIDITSEGLAIDGEPLITKKANGELHIGKNSWITKEENGRQKVYAKDANGNSIPIDYTNGTKLLINGRDVEQSINNVGALSAALTGLPTVPTDTTLACGLGTGTHGGDFAFSGGCASKVNDKLSINYAASMTMPGQDYAGDFEDTFSARAGFVWKLGKATKPTQISMKETKELKEEIADLKENNKNIIAQNDALLARLERLEKVALGDLKTKDLAVYQLK
nr:YadA-like family protein [Prochlorococcus marinus]